MTKMLSGGVQPVRVVLRAMALLHMHRGISAPRIAEFVPLTAQAIRKVGHRYVEGGIERALYEKERPGAAALLEDKQRASGLSRWFVPILPKVMHAGPCGWWPRKR